MLSSEIYGEEEKKKISEIIIWEYERKTYNGIRKAKKKGEKGGIRKQRERDL